MGLEIANWHYNDDLEPFDKFYESALVRMYAVIETGGKQYQVHEGDVVFVEKLDVEADDTVTFDKVVAVNADNGITVGAPYVEGAAVKARF